MTFLKSYLSNGVSNSTYAVIIHDRAASMVFHVWGGLGGWDCMVG